MSFNGKTAIITGAAQGIGLEISRRLMLAGANVVLNDTDDTLLHKAVEQLQAEKHPAACAPFCGNAGDATLIKQMVDFASERFGRVDIAIANAGITLFGDFFSYAPADFEKLMQLNLSGSFFLAQAAALQMRKQSTRGSILLMSSVTAHQSHKDLAAYGMSKAAIEMLARNLVTELSPFHININAIAPGATLTERTLQDSNYRNEWASRTPMGTAASVTDIADAALFMVSDQARHITGQTLIIDGGWTCVSP